jgi:hypothetical protein
MVEAMTTMPRVLSDVARIDEVLKNIEGEMQSLAAQLRTFDLRNVAGVEDLSRLDNLKNNMEQVHGRFDDLLFIACSQLMLSVECRIEILKVSIV